MHYIYRFLKAVKIEKFHWKFFYILMIFPQNIDCGYSLETAAEAVLMSTHNQCFGAILRKIVLPL